MRNTAPRATPNKDMIPRGNAGIDRTCCAAELALVDRLVKVYWPPWLHEYYEKHNPWDAEPIGYRNERERVNTKKYDERRVAHFLDMLTLGLNVEPVQIDCRWYGAQPGPPEVVDGHHRYVAHVIYGARHIPMSFGGLVVVKEWLQGKREAWPEIIALDMSRGLY